MPEDVRVSEGLADTLEADGSVTTPAAGAAIATLAAPPKGTYEIRASLVTGGTLAAADVGNAQVKAGATVLGRLLAGDGEEVFDHVTLDGATAVTVNAIALGTTGAVYAASIRATRIA